MRPTANTDARPIGRSTDLDKWLELGLLVASGAAILMVVTWIESALVG